MLKSLLLDGHLFVCASRKSQVMLAIFITSNQIVVAIFVWISSHILEAMDSSMKHEISNRYRASKNVRQPMCSWESLLGTLFSGLKWQEWRKRLWSKRPSTALQDTWPWYDFWENDKQYSAQICLMVIFRPLGKVSSWLSSLLQLPDRKRRQYHFCWNKGLLAAA